MQPRILHYLLASGLCLSLPAQTMPPEINLVVVEGEGVVNHLRQRATHDPVVRVEDENHRPVSGAAVVFTLPVSGVTGEFLNGSKSLTVVTDEDGLAAAHGLKTNQVEGKLQIYVTASYRGLRGRALVNQFTMAAAGADKTHKKGGGKTWAILVAIGAAAAAGCAVAATHKVSSPTSATTFTPAAPAAITISPGTGSISPPR